MQISLVGNQSFANVKIPIIDDELAEGAEGFGAELVVESTSRNMSSVSTIIIEIIDDDSKH